MQQFSDSLVELHLLTDLAKLIWFKVHIVGCAVVF